MPTARLMIYGASGQTGRELAAMAVHRGLQPILAGRDINKLQSLAASLGRPYVVAQLGETARLIDHLQQVTVVLNAAGPFAETWRSLAKACLLSGAHYLDVSGELPVFQSLRQWHSEALRQGVMLMPGCGFMVTASDLLAAHVVKRMPGADSLHLGFSRSCFASKGTLKSLASMASSDTQVYRDGSLVRLPLGSVQRTFQLDQGAELCMSLPLADVLTAHLTTGIPNVAAYLATDRKDRHLWNAGRYFAGTLHTPIARALTELALEARAPIPPRWKRQRYRQCVVAEAIDLSGRKVMSRLHTSDSYSFTCHAAIAIAEAALSGRVLPGFQSPAAIFDRPLVDQLGYYRVEDCRR